MMTKRELYRQMDRFAKDKNRAVSWEFFGELAGISPLYLREIFIYRKHPMSETTQIRVSRALEKLKNGEVTVMQNRDQTRFLQYNKEPKPRVVRDNRIAFENGQFKLQIGLRNKSDYSQPDLNEQIGDKNGRIKVI